VIASKNWTLNAAATARKKIRRRLNRSADDFDSTEIRLGKSAKFDGAGVYHPHIDSSVISSKSHDHFAFCGCKSALITFQNVVWIVMYITQ